MRSLIIIEVEHGEDTDGLSAFADYVSDPMTDHDVTVLDYTVKVDVPECFVLDTTEACRAYFERETRRARGQEGW